jgi:phospholipase C
LHVHGRIDKASGRYWLDFANEGTAGAGLNVYSLNRTDGPWFYTVEAGRTLSDYWSARAVTQGIYDLSVYGPNGFLRQFQGNLNAAVAAGGADADVTARYDVPNNRLILRLRNRGTGSCRLTVRANHYTSAAPRSYTLAPGKELDVMWPLSASAHWYDISVTSDRDTGFLRRLAGHMETGRASVSDPLIGAPTDRLFADGYDDVVEAAEDPAVA